MVNLFLLDEHNNQKNKKHDPIHKHGKQNEFQTLKKKITTDHSISDKITEFLKTIFVSD